MGEQAVQEKVSGSQLQQLSDAFASVQSKIGSVEHAVWEGMDGRLQKFDGAVASLRKQLAGLELTLGGKVCSIDLQQLSEVLAGVRTRTSGAEQAIRVGAERVQQLSNTVTGLTAQCDLVKQLMSPVRPNIANKRRMLGDAGDSNS